MRPTRLFQLLLPLIYVAALIAGLTLAVSQYRELFGPPLPLSDQHHDFLAYYSAATLASQHHLGQIYQAAPLTHIQRQIIPSPVGAAGYMPFLNPPVVVALMTPLAHLSEASARLIWWLANVILMCSLAWLVTRGLQLPKRLLALPLLVLTLPVYQALIEGQVSTLVLAGCIAAILAARRERPVLAGICLSVLWLKPQLGLMALVVLLACRSWRTIGGYLGAAAGLVVVMLPITGLSVYFDYFNFLTGVFTAHFNGAGAVAHSVWHGALSQTEGLNGFFTTLFGQANLTVVNAFTFLTAAALVGLLLFTFSRVKPGLNTKNNSLMLIATGSALLLLDPHLYLQDVVILYTIILLLQVQHHFRLILAIVVLADLTTVDYYLHFHLFTLTLLILTVGALLYLRSRNAPTMRAVLPAREGD